MNRYFVIDIGTNSARLLSAEITKTGVRTLSRKVITCRTGENVDKTGLLGEEAVARTLSAIDEFMEIIAEEGSSANVFCYATSAVRDSSNREDFKKRLRDRFGLDLMTLSGAEEALYGFIGAVPGGTGALLDIGGGSTEFIYGKDGSITYSKSFQLGCVRSLDRFGSEQVTYDMAYDCFGGIAAPSSIEVTGVGGTITSFAAMDQKLVPYDSNRVHGYLLTRKAVNALTELLWKTPVESRPFIPGLHPKRADIIGYGGAILSAFMDRFDIDSIRVSECDAMEGLLMIKCGAISAPN